MAASGQASEAVPGGFVLTESQMGWIYFSRGLPLLTSDQKNQVAKAKARHENFAPGMAKTSRSQKRKAAPTVGEMLRVEPWTNTTVRRKQFAPREEGPSVPVSIAAAPAAASISIVAAPAIVPVAAQAAAIDVPVPTPPYVAAPPTAEAPLTAPEPCIVVPSLSKWEEVV
ncbi:uncharacterized protein LOC131254867 [Magnolia sinica]|uniref:uncharacterized protein LOC131254867 n=1 Tax=Magnolia sinica TaxID=86752 RepID=UPI00265A8E03|nr:uncharacterized protein LOC131254867 [Magnolia sinica]